jgi:hypothetical protein
MEKRRGPGRPPKNPDAPKRGPGRPRKDAGANPGSQVKAIDSASLEQLIKLLRAHRVSHFESGALRLDFSHDAFVMNDDVSRPLGATQLPDEELDEEIAYASS